MRLRKVTAGAIAGAAGTTALNIVTYLDMLVRGRPASSVPEQVASEIVEGKAGVDLAFDKQGSAEKEAASNRREAMGALMGYERGMTTALVYTLAGSRLRVLPAPVAGLILGTVAVVASEVPAALLGKTDPRRRDRSDWLSDIAPRMVYGIVTAWVVDRLVSSDRS